MIVTVDDLLELLRSLGAPAWRLRAPFPDLYKAVENTALDLWLDRKPETPEAEELRRQLLHWYEHDEWDYSRGESTDGTDR